MCDIIGRILWIGMIMILGGLLLLSFSYRAFADRPYPFIDLVGPSQIPGNEYTPPSIVGPTYNDYEDTRPDAPLGYIHKDYTSGTTCYGYSTNQYSGSICY